MYSFSFQIFELTLIGLAQTLRCQVHLLLWKLSFHAAPPFKALKRDSVHLSSKGISSPGSLTVLPLFLPVVSQLHHLQLLSDHCSLYNTFYSHMLVPPLCSFNRCIIFIF